MKRSIGIKSLNLLIVLAVSVQVFHSSCKKGEDDPAFSFKSRSKRIDGSWKIKEGKVRIAYYSGSSYIDQTYELSDAKYKISVGGKGTYEGPHKLDLKFSEDGTFEVKENFDTISFSSTGKWDFMRKGGDSKNKERIILRLDRGKGSSNYYAFFNKSMTTFVYSIRELRKDRLVLETDNDLVEMDDQGHKTNSTVSYVLQR